MSSAMAGSAALDPLGGNAIQQILEEQAGVGVDADRHGILPADLKRIGLNLNDLGVRD